MQGSIRRRGEGRWQVRVFVGRDPATGRIRLREKTVHGTKRDAQRVLADLVAAVDQKLLGATDAITLAELLDRWLEQAAPDFSPKTVLEVRGYIRRTIAPLIGSRLVADLTTADLDAFYQHLRVKGGKAAGLAPATIQRIHGILRRALSQAVRWSIIRHNPALDASKPRVPKPDLSPPTPAQVAALFRSAEETEPALAMFVLLAAGVDVRTVAGRLGHRDASTTLNIYSHFIPESDQRAAGLLGQVFDDAMAGVTPDRS